MDWTLFGWAGIQLEIPHTWEISGISGDEKNGYLRLDDSEMPRLELKWAKTRKKKPDLHNTLDEYFKLVRKNYKRGGNVSFRRNVDLIKDEDFLKDSTVLGFSWKGGIRANGLIIHNPNTKRIIIVQVMGRLKENWASDRASHLQIHFRPSRPAAYRLECLRSQACCPEKLQVRKPKTSQRIPVVCIYQREKS